MADRTDVDRLADVNEAICGGVENGPWVLIPDPALRRIVGEYVADTCHTIAVAAGLDEAMQVAHDATPTRLSTSLPGVRVAADARDRLARHFFVASVGELWATNMAAAWDRGEIKPGDAAPYLAQADAILAVITGEARDSGD